MPHARSFAGRLGLFLLFCFVLELACRVEDWVRYRTPLLSRMTNSGHLMVRDADGAHGRPNSRYQKWVMNSLGMRGPEVPAVASPSTTRIVVAGASETFGLYESPNREYPRQLEDSLNADPACATSGRRVEVLNSALPGMVLPTIERDLLTRVRRLHPAVVLLYPSPVFYVDDERPFATPPDSTGGDQLPAWRALVPRAYDRVREQLKLLLPKWIQIRLRAREVSRALARHPAGWQFTSVPEDRLEAYDTDLRRVIGTVREIGAEPVVMTHANYMMQPGYHDPNVLSAWAKTLPRATEQAIVSFDSAAVPVTLRATADSGVTTVDVARAFSRRFPEPIFVDFVHFTDYGAARMASLAASGIRRILPECGIGDVPHNAKKVGTGG